MSYNLDYIYFGVVKRETDSQYRNMLAEIITNGESGSTRQGVDCITLPYPVTMNFNLANGFPVITERDISAFWQAPINELFAFINGVQTEQELRSKGVRWWKPWATAKKCQKRGLVEGDLGPGSYGFAFHAYPSPDGKSFDQFAELVEQIRQYPDDRRHMVTSWLPPYVFRSRDPNSRVTIAPCHGSLVHVRVLNGTLNLHMVQRSGDVPVGVPSNMVQYAALMLAMCHLLQLKPGVYSHVILDPHIYTDQIDAVAEMLIRPARILPSVYLTDLGKVVTDIHDFTGHHFRLADYEPHPAIGAIPVAS